MKVLICGARGCVGSAVASALRSRDHKVVEGARGAPNGPFSLDVDYAEKRAPADWAAALTEAQIGAVVNCVGILVPCAGQTFERVHTDGPIELFQGAALAGVSRVIQVSALGASGGAGSRAMPYLHSKWLADEALAALALDWAVLRPSLVYGPRSQSAALFATLASLPLIGLPGRGQQAVAPIHVFELAEAIALLVERKGALRRVYEIGGPQVLNYREMLAQYRAALGFGQALWLPVPMFAMKACAWVAEWLPQQTFCRDTLRPLERGSAPTSNSAPLLLGRQPTTLAQGLVVSPPQPLLDMRVQLSSAMDTTLRASLAFLWLYTALVTLALPHQSGVLRLLARCGFEENLAWGVMLGSCLLNGALGIATLWRPSPAVYLLQAAAVLGYSVTAALNMPELTIDHCGPLAKNAPVLALVLLLAMAQPLDMRAARDPRARRSRNPAQKLAPQRAPVDERLAA